MRYEEIKTLVANTKTEKMIDEKSNELISYRISPLEGYKLHSNIYDEEIIDEETLEPTGEIRLGYICFPSFIQVGCNYDFKKNPYKFFTIPNDDND